MLLRFILEKLLLSIYPTKFINDEMLNVLIFFINELIEFFLLKSDLIKKRLFGYFFFNFLTAFEFLLYCKITTQLLFKKTLIT